MLHRGFMAFLSCSLKTQECIKKHTTVINQKKNPSKQANINERWYKAN